MSLFGYWGSILLYFIPVFLAVMHLVLDSTYWGRQEGDPNYWEYLNNDIVLISVGTVMWLFSALVHILYIPRFVAHAAVNFYRRACVCSAGEELFPDATVEEILKHETEL